MRLLLTTGALAATLSTAGAVGTVASAPAAAAQYIAAQVCEAAGGEPVEDDDSPTGFVCKGGTYDGQPVELD